MDSRFFVYKHILFQTPGKPVSLKQNEQNTWIYLTPGSAPLMMYYGLIY